MNKTRSWHHQEEKFESPITDKCTLDTGGIQFRPDKKGCPSTRALPVFKNPACPRSERDVGHTLKRR